MRKGQKASDETKRKLSESHKGKISNYKHGFRYYRLYVKWGLMKSRCYNTRNNRFSNYGGRGIKVCDEWLHDAKAFVEWSLANGYQPGLQIDRIDSDGNYEPSNCRYVPPIIQAGNKRIQKNRSLPTGIRKRGNKFHARIKRTYLGSFSTIEKAVAAYQKAKEDMVFLSD